MADVMRCPECGEWKVPFGGEAVCGENGCPGPDDDDGPSYLVEEYDELDLDGFVRR
jgi:hypothetical protein